MKNFYAIAGTAMCFFLLILNTYSTQAQNSWSRGVLNLTVTQQEGMQRIASAFEAEGYTIHISGNDYIAAKKRNHSAVITCNDACDGNAFINLFVISTAFGANEPAIQREKLQAQIVKPRPSTTPYVTKPLPTANMIQGNWETKAGRLNGRPGDRFTLKFPPNGTISEYIWGSDLYVDDSSIATAAVHAGLITVKDGGTVTIELRPGQKFYPGGMRNGIESNSSTEYTGSFVFLVDDKPYTPQGEIYPGVIMGTWLTKGDKYRDKIGGRFTYYFPGNGTLTNRVWGTDVYSDDSSIAAAAVHAGLINTKTGGTVTIEIMPGQGGYDGSTRNGATTNNYGEYAGSFKFVK